MTIRRQVLIVDDDELLRESLGDQIRLHEEFTCFEVATGAKALELIRSAYFDVIVLDIGLPDMDGREVCRLMRRDGVTTPIIMLTGATSDADTILGFEAGANDYVTKPFRTGTLLARLRAQIRQHERSNDAVFAIGHFTFKPVDRLLLEGGANKRIRLTDKEMGILKLLCRADGETVMRTELLSEVWGYEEAVETHTLETHIYRLRRKIEHDPANPEILLADPGGYRLVR